MTVAKFEKRTKKTATDPDPPAAECACETIALAIGELRVTSRCPTHRHDPAPNESPFHVDRNLIAAINSDLALLDVAHSDRGVHTLVIFCAHLMATMRIIDTFPSRVDLLSRIHRECELALNELLKLPKMETPPQS